MTTNLGPSRRSRGLRRMILIGVSLMTFSFGWLGRYDTYWTPDSQREETKREKIVKANPFLERFTVADLRTWADRKMRVPNSYLLNSAS